LKNKEKIVEIDSSIEEIMKRLWIPNSTK
jgi:hypothetical protein